MVAVLFAYNYFFLERVLETYTSDPLIIAEGLKYKNLLGIAILPMGVNNMLQGVLVAINLQAYGSMVNVSGLLFYLPAQLILQDMKSQWVARIFIEFYIAIGYHIIISFQSWEKQAEISKERLAK